MVSEEVALAHYFFLSFKVWDARSLGLGLVRPHHVDHVACARDQREMALLLCTMLPTGTL